MAQLSIVNYCLIIFIASTSLGIKDTKDAARTDPPIQLTLKHYGECEEYPSLPVTQKNVSIWVDPENETQLYATGLLVINMTLRKGEFQYLLKLKRCLREVESSCEKYLEIVVNDMCERFLQKGKAWSSFIETLENFNPHCPIPAGEYRFKDAMFDASSLTNSSMAEGYWMIESKFISSQGKTIFCVIAAVSVKRKRVNTEGKRLM